MPAVSVVIPTYNRRQFVPAAIDSVLAQSFRDFEIIVVDDGSSDGTAELLARDYPAIRTIVLPANGGRSMARNVGWAMARGDYVAFLDSDDLWQPDKLARQVPLFADPQVVLVHGWVGKVDIAGRPLTTETAALEREFALAARRGYGYGGITRTWCRMYTSAVVLRRPLLQTTGGFDPRLSNFEDWDMLWRVARSGTVATVEETLVLHRAHPDNTPNIWALAAIPWLAVNRKHLAELGAGAIGAEERRGRANLLLNMALGEYWRRDLPASRRWMWRALATNPRILAQPGYYVWCAPLLHALLPHAIADRLIARGHGDPYTNPALLA